MIPDPVKAVSAWCQQTIEFAMSMDDSLVYPPGPEGAMQLHREAVETARRILQEAKDESGDKLPVWVKAVARKTFTWSFDRMDL